MAEKSKTVAVFMYDGTEKYNNMTVNAIKSFLAATHGITVGILVPPSLRQPDWASILGSESRGRIDVRQFRQHFTNWNPTQHKLDIELFGDTYDFVLWVDSDTVAFSDVGKLVSDFAKTSCQFALVEDLVTSKPNFQQRWAAATGSTNLKPFVPQTALMLFRKSAFARVFPTWESIWRKWIEPAPFAHYGDPDPAFQGSAFCIEQYALGLALEQLSLLSDTVMYRIPRRQILFKDVGAGGNGVGNGTFSVPLSSLVGGVNTSGAASIAHSSYGSSGSSYAVVPVSGGSYQLSSYLPASVSSYSLTSYSYYPSSSQAGSYAFSSAGGASSYQLGSYQLSSYPQTSYQVGSYAGSYQGGSYQLGSYQLGSYQLSSAQGSYQVGSYQPSSYAGSYQAGSLQLGSHQLGSYTESARASEALGGTHMVGVIGLNTGLNYDIVVDSFAGAILHFYSFNYEPGYKVWTQHGAKVRETLDAVWAPKP